MSLPLFMDHHVHSGITQDDDFLEIADRWQQASRHFAGIIYAHQELYDTVIFLPL